jgi:RuvB-like protein 1 (pontin 52)
MIIRTLTYDLETVMRIVATRAGVEGIEIDEAALARLGEVGVRTSLRHAVQLLTPAAVLARTAGSGKVTVAEIEDVESLFSDAKRSAKRLQEDGDSFLV